MSYITWPIMVLVLIMLIEGERGQLKKKWQQWALLSVYLFVPWVIVFGLEKLIDWRMTLVGNLILPVFYLLGIFLFGFKDYFASERPPLEQENTIYKQKRQILWRYLDIFGSGILASSFCDAIGFLIASQMNAKSIGGIFANEFKNNIAILEYSMIWAITTFVIVLIGGSFSDRKIAFGLITGTFTSICLIYVHINAPVLTRCAVILAPLLGGYMGAKLSFLIDDAKNYIKEHIMRIKGE